MPEVAGGDSSKACLAKSLSLVSLLTDIPIASDLAELFNESTNK